MAAPVPSSPSFASLSSTSASSPNDSDEQPQTPKVRFDQECVLIPDPVPQSRMPRLVTKSYSLPLWRRKRDPSIDSEDDLLDEQVVFKVSVPRSVSTICFLLPHVTQTQNILLRTAASPQRRGHPRAMQGP